MGGIERREMKIAIPEIESADTGIYGTEETNLVAKIMEERKDCGQLHQLELFRVAIRGSSILSLIEALRNLIVLLDKERNKK